MTGATWWRLVRRMREPSSMAGLSALALLAGAHAETAQQISQAAAAVLALAAVLIPEGGQGE